MILQQTSQSISHASHCRLQCRDCMDGSCSTSAACTASLLICVLLLAQSAALLLPAWIITAGQ